MPKTMCGLCKKKIVNHVEGTAQCHKDCFAEFLISFNIPTEEVAEKIEHIIELKPEENSILHFRLGTELIPASSQAIEAFKAAVERSGIFDNLATIIVTSSLVDIRVVTPE